MKVACPHCRKAYDIAEERLQQLGTPVAFPCPACKGKIELDEHLSTQAPDVADDQPSTAERLPSGEALKKNILKTLQELPPMPQVAQKARQLISDEKSSFTDLAKIIETDQAIAARVLKLSNSPYYGVAGSVTSIQHASVVLGMKTLNELLTLACASSLLGSQLSGYGLDSGDLWKHSLAAAACARSLSNKKNPGLADDAFSAGLIHDCGKLILAPYVAERTTRFDDFMQDGQRSFLEAEKSILGFDHAQIAAAVCEKWQIPKKLILAIQYHHSPSELQYNELALIVHTADAIALMCGIGTGVDGMMYHIDKKAMEFLELDTDTISVLMAEATEYVEKTITA